MKISYNWIKQYIDIDKTPDELAEILTDIGLEVEGMETWQSVKGGLDGLVVGEVLTCKKHENSDHLSLTTVDIGQENPLNVVCGAPNVAAGQKVVVATIGTTLYNGDESFVIKKGKIRGTVSEGMICAEDEIGLGTSHDGIMVLTGDVEVGKPAKEYFDVENDVVFEIGLTPNRIDAGSHYGVARDLAAWMKQNGEVSLRKPDIDNFEVDNKNTPIEVRVENPEACHRYSGLTITGLQVKESPTWLKNRLKAIGMNPINNIVDITNFVLHETGQPLHAFDLDEVSGNKVIVKMMDNKAKFTTLDEVERELSDKDLMICNQIEGMCIAGVFGGIKSGVTEKTTSIFLESAWFDAVYVRKTARRHGLNTDSSFRFERGTDPNITVYALKRAALLIKELAGGEISSDIIDIYPKPAKDFRVEVKYAHVDRLIGNKLPKDTIKGIITSLEMKIVEESESALVIDVPPYRVDVTREADVIEDILRIYGYNNVDFGTQVRSTLAYAQKPDGDKLKEVISQFLSSNGFNEGMSNSLTKESYYENGETFKAENAVKIFNPLSSDLGVMRQTLLYGGLEAVIYNINRKNQDIRLYEFGNCYFYNPDNEIKNPLGKYTEEKRLAMFISGAKQPENWNLKTEPTSFFQLKAYVDNTLGRLGYKPEMIKIHEISSDIFGYGLKYEINSQCFVEFGAVIKNMLQQFDIENDVFFADFKWDKLVKYYKDTLEYIEPAKFPAVRRDLALLIDKNVKFAELKEIAHKTEKKLLKEVAIFDCYEGKNIADEKKSYALSFILQDEKKTLTDKQIDKIMNKLIKSYENQVNAQIR